MGTCTALNIHDSASPCVEPATNANGQFCQFHARQVQGLYEGYKRRSLELEALEKNAPKCLPRNFGNTDFTAVKTLPQLKEIYAYMLQRYNLVTRCVMARDFHHSHFYADKSDFGHQAYLERLRSTRALLTTTLGRLEKRTLDVQYSNAQWYDWVESIQADMDAKSEAEKKKVKAEAALFKAHQETVSKLRDEEEVKRRIQIEKEEVWDPIEEIIEDARAGYVALIRVLINAEGVEEKEMELALKRAKEINAAATGELGARMAESKADRLLAQRRRHMEAFLMREHVSAPALSTSGLHVQSHEEGVKEELERRNRKRISDMDKIKRVESEEEEPKKKEQAKKKKGRKGKKNRSSEKVPAPMVESDHGEEIGNAEGTQEAPDSEDDPLDIDAIRDQDMKAIIQSITDLVIANQPALGINVDSEGGSGKVRAEVRVVHEYLLLRSIIASPSLLSAAILSSSIDEFLRDTVHVRNSDLRDLALDLSKPSDDSIRDACADYWAGEKMGNLESTGDDELSNELVVHQPKLKDGGNGNKKGKRGRSEHAPQVPEKGGKMDRVKICGKWIYNYPAETKMPRRGWFQFAILTGTSFFTAASLCKSWQEFYELNILSLNGYFRGLKNGWDTTRESPPLAHLRRIGFIPYALSHNSIHASGFTQTSRHSGSSVRLHAATEARNYIAANMSRDDPRVYRFIEILKTHRSELIVYIKDCKSGQTLVDPPIEERWIIRDKIGAGRLHRGKWTIRHPFDKAFKTTLERERLWQSFRDCLDVVIWDRLPARPPEHLQYTLMKLLHKAFKFTDHISVLESTLEVYYRTAKEEEGKEGLMAARVRDIKMAIREYRRKSDAEGEKKERPKRSHYLFYDSVDEDVDKDHPYDAHTTWDIKSTLKGDAGLRELAQQHRLATDDKEAERLEKILMERLLSKIVEKMPQEREPTIDDDLEDQEEDWEDASDSYWDDGEDGHMEFVGIWDQAKAENDTLYDQAEDFSHTMFEQQLKTFPGKEQHYQEQRKFLKDVGRRQNNMNTKTRQKLEKKEQELMTGAPFIPQNFMRCQYIIERLWGESAEVSKQEVREYRKEFEALHDKEQRAKFPPKRRPPKGPQCALDEWDKLRPKRGESMDSYDIPREWEHAIQKNITRLWKKGLIQPSWAMTCVPVFVGREGPGKPLYLYSDYRGLVITGRLLCPTTGDPDMQVPPGPNYLREEMEKYETKHPGSTYSLLRVASEPDCWPSEMCEEDALHTAIVDREGRIWEWVKTPKDMPWSEYIMHDNIRYLLRDPPSLNPTSEKSVTSYVRHSVDTILIMGNEDKCKQWTTLCLGYVRKQPHGYEIDLGRSFLRVDAKFLRGLQECWWDQIKLH